MPKKNDEPIIISPFSPELDAIKREDPADNQHSGKNNPEIVSAESITSEDETIPSHISYPG
nr:hypothetical protein [Neobacillus sp. Marseille-Q6967]